jgi:hypothetical protein
MDSKDEGEGMRVQQRARVRAAYGRAYYSPEAAAADWRAGADFQLTAGRWAGGYCSTRDFRAGTVVEIAYPTIAGDWPNAQRVTLVQGEEGFRHDPR